MCGHGCVARNLIASLEQHSGKLGKFSKLQVAFPHDIWQNSSFIFYCCLGTGPFIQTSNANGDQLREEGVHELHLWEDVVWRHLAHSDRVWYVSHVCGASRGGDGTLR